MAKKQKKKDPNTGLRDAKTNGPKSNVEKEVPKRSVPDAAGNEINGKGGSNVSSCVVELKVVWLNFAAPPRAPITRKIDYTR